jgi:hypothetical protein
MTMRLVAWGSLHPTKVSRTFLDVCDLSALVFKEERRSRRIFNNASAMRKAVYGLTVLYSLDKVWNLCLPLRTTRVCVGA